jgi:hypothetical protein
MLARRLGDSDGERILDNVRFLHDVVFILGDVFFIVLYRRAADR